MSERFRDKVAVVTGGVSGIGASITERLAAEGARVLAVDINEQLAGTATDTFGPSVTGHVADVTDEGAYDGAIARAVSELGGLDMVFNVAGGSKAAPLVAMSYADWDFTIRLNLYSAFLGTKLAANHFIAEGKPGAIVNVASLNSFVPLQFGAGYSASKAAVVMLTKQAALELAEHGIRVNAVSPGLVDTPMTAAMTQAPPVRDAFLERIPLNRAAQPQEVAAAALFLASEDASYISGDNLVVDGAWATSGYPDLRKFMS
ncbi:SDR family oxidoreductase [Georgenia sp. TF02-10]|uniref:SDR family NAD(P)-dependent oxidoreductase n=1 Tax=Georgenia sp. TF02-10 TaxID=2917725 RepID=UPI001FA6B3DD|nr:SDR family NAD(P)-dependent oxidoreductase [Georgenia sp. TF02-10]UNX54768.1 SDR family oxidoreductase [Georgenia sp. TF02-10]